ncbi:spermatogenesis-associated serine-rich protein 2 isoform X2 [Triplophysa rosa]|uniref:spermatogenesis-associated serine-rich protein 2 isoform X2 n=1 Tax=Triplophysa rosa TaxID=992332 RepID=UPI0025462BB1|nr:spermatogenesis-associated serine-rich protein 2 isoform X2 [Triplophysa rosa]
MMAKKSSGKDVSGVVFDTHSKVVMSQGGTFEKMKEKINAVRAVVPNKSNNEIALVLQHFENCVDRAVQAFVEGSAVEILKEWNVTGKKKPKKKKKPKPQTEAPVDPAPADSTPDAECPEALNGFHANGSAGADGDSLDSLSEQLDSLDTADLDVETAAPELSEATGGEGTSNPTPSPTPQHGTGANVDRSVKDLQRCAASLTRYRVVVRDEMDSSIKKMKQTFAELQSCLMDREVTLFAEMDKVKAEAMAILDGRQKRAEELKRLTDQSASLKEEQLTELRADIKHFVSERKYDEDLGKAVKFSFDLEPLKCSITSFGSVYHPQTSYSSRSRCSSTSSSVTSSTSELQHQPSAYMARPNVPHKQIFQGNRRIIQGYQGNQRYNGNGHRDRNPGRTNSRYQGDCYHGDHRESPNSQPANSVKSPSHPSAYHPDQPSHNGLPQRQPRSHCL